MMNEKSIVQVAGSILLLFVLVAFAIAYVNASFCEPGYSAVRNVWNWPVCIKVQ